MKVCTGITWGVVEGGLIHDPPEEEPLEVVQRLDQVKDYIERNLLWGIDSLLKIPEAVKHANFLAHQYTSEGWIEDRHRVKVYWFTEVVDRSLYGFRVNLRYRVETPEGMVIFTN